jgi:hypothetical protein
MTDFSPSLAPAPALAAWLGLVGLGAFHGLNPAMGWLLAVALGLQERRRAAIWRALPAIALGHEASVAVAAALVTGLHVVASSDVLRLASALLLFGFGAFKLLRPGRAHVRWVGLRLSWWDLVGWSFLMSSAHGAGLMLAPVLLGLPAAHDHDDLAALGVNLGALDAAALVQAFAAVALHTLAMLVVMGGVASLVYDRLGLGVLRRAWLNLDLVWAVALLTAGVLTALT